MKKYLLPALILFVFITLWLLTISFSKIAIDFLALGIIPGTNIETGIYLPIVAGTIAFVLLVAWLRQVSAELMEYKTKEALNEQATTTQSSTPAAMPEHLPLNTEEIDLLSI